MLRILRKLVDTQIQESWHFCITFAKSAKNHKTENPVDIVPPFPGKFLLLFKDVPDYLLFGAVSILVQILKLIYDFESFSADDLITS